MTKNECATMEKDEKQDKKKEIDKGKYVPMTAKEIRKLADDLYKGLVFTDRDIRIKEDLPRVFMPLALMGKELADELEKNPPGMIYEYFHKAGPMAIDGMPIFASFKMVSIEDTKKVLIHYNKIKEAVENI
jgi:hypothetical protein